MEVGTRDLSASQTSERARKNRRMWLYILGVVAFIIFGYTVYVLYQIGSLKARAQRATDFWFRDVGIGGLEGGASTDVCDDVCSKVCLGPRPDTNPLNLLLLPITRARICCHDKCNKSGCGVARPYDTYCGHRINWWSALPTAGISCIFEIIK